MEEPIKAGDRNLCWDGGCWKEYRAVAALSLASFHPEYLRIPDRFQKQECPNVTVTAQWNGTTFIIEA